MLELNQKQRALLAEKLPDAANVAAGALIFGQFLGEHGFSPLLMLGGTAIWLVLVGVAVVLARR